MVHQLTTSHRAQSRGSEQAQEAAKQIEEAARLQEAALRDLVTSIDRVRKAALG